MCVNKINLTMVEISDLFEFLRSKNTSPDSDDILNTISDDVLNTRIIILTGIQGKLISCLKVNYWDEVSMILSTVYNNHSKYNYITDGIDFVGHVRKKATFPVYMYIGELFAVQEILQSIQKELRKRIEHIELNIDEEMKIPCIEYRDYCIKKVAIIKKYKWKKFDKNPVVRNDDVV